MTDIFRAGERLTLDLYSVLVIDLSFTSMKSRYVYNLLADILRSGESLNLNLCKSVLVVYLSINKKKILPH